MSRFTSALDAASYLSDRARNSKSVRDLVAKAWAARGYDDLYDWAENKPDEVIAMAEAVHDLESQTDDFRTEMQQRGRR